MQHIHTQNMPQTHPMRIHAPHRTHSTHTDTPAQCTPHIAHSTPEIPQTHSPRHKHAHATHTHTHTHACTHRQHPCPLPLWKAHPAGWTTAQAGLGLREPCLLLAQGRRPGVGVGLKVPNPTPSSQVSRRAWEGGPRSCPEVFLCVHICEYGVQTAQSCDSRGPSRLCRGLSMWSLSLVHVVTQPCLCGHSAVLTRR